MVHSGHQPMKSCQPMTRFPFTLHLSSVSSGREMKHLQHCLPPPWDEETQELQEREQEMGKNS